MLAMLSTDPCQVKMMYESHISGRYWMRLLPYGRDAPTLNLVGKQHWNFQVGWYFVEDFFADSFDIWLLLSRGRRQKVGDPFGLR